jgi:hypothetical protein
MAGQRLAANLADEKPKNVRGAACPLLMKSAATKGPQERTHRPCAANAERRRLRRRQGLGGLIHYYYGGA